MNKTKNISIRVWLSIIATVIGISIIFWFIIRGIWYENFINIKTPIDLENASKIGDFIGGFVGVIFTLVGVILLFETLVLQRKELTDSRKVFERQQFENKFFSLLNLYQEILSTLHYEAATSSTKYTGKEYFAIHKKEIFEKYNPIEISFLKDRKQAIDSYISNFYIKNKEYIAHYFRTLYRMFRLIETSSFDIREKEEYAKIVRGQLSEAELFFLNYNACTDQGAKFRILIITYNLTKHLPLLERLEFKRWKLKLDDVKINSVNLVFQEILDFLYSKHSKFYKTYLKGRFSFLIQKSATEIKFEIIRNNNQEYSNYIQRGFGLDDFTNEELEQLLKAWCYETFYNRNYNLFYERNALKFEVDIVNLGENKNKVVCVIKAKDKNIINII